MTQKKPKRQQVKVACVACRQSHSSCDSVRPCKYSKVHLYLSLFLIK